MSLVVMRIVVSVVNWSSSKSSGSIRSISSALVLLGGHVEIVVHDGQWVSDQSLLVSNGIVVPVRSSRSLVVWVSDVSLRVIRSVRSVVRSRHLSSRSTREESTSGSGLMLAISSISMKHI